MLTEVQWNLNNEIVTAGNIKELGTLDNQVILQADKLKTIQEKGNKRNYILFVSFCS